MDTTLSDDAVLAWARLVKAQPSILAAVEAELKRAGFPPLAWYDSLLELDRAESGRLRPFELEDRMLLAQYNLSRLIDRLEKSGYTKRRPHPEDGRGQIVEITKAGRALLRKMWPVYAGAISRHLGDKLSDYEAKTLARLLGKLLD